MVVTIYDMRADKCGVESPAELSEFHHSSEIDFAAFPEFPDRSHSYVSVRTNFVRTARRRVSLIDSCKLGSIHTSPAQSALSIRALMPRIKVRKVWARIMLLPK